MTDSLINAIDRIYDVVDNGVSAADRVLNRGKYTEEQLGARRVKRAPDVIDVESAPASAPASPPAKTKAKFRIVESVPPGSKTTIFVVTNGSERAECATRALAEKILRGLETSK